MGFFETLKKKLTDLMDTKPEQPTKSTTKPQAQKEPFVYVTTKGKKFHYSLLCPGIRNSKEVKMTLSKARKAGYTACDKCEKYQYIEDYELL